MPTEFGGKLEMPKEPIGKGICDYFCWFEKDFEGNPLPFTFRFLFDIPVSVGNNYIPMYTAIGKNST